MYSMNENEVKYKWSISIVSLGKNFNLRMSKII